MPDDIVFYIDFLILKISLTLCRGDFDPLLNVRNLNHTEVK